MCTLCRSPGTTLKLCTISSTTFGNYKRMWILIVTHIKHTKSGHLAPGQALAPPWKITSCLFILFCNPSHRSHGQISIAVFTHSTLSKHTWLLSARQMDASSLHSDARLIQKQVDMINEVQWRRASRIWESLIKIWSGVVSRLTAFRSGLDLKHSPSQSSVVTVV